MALKLRARAGDTLVLPSGEVRIARIGRTVVELYIDGVEVRLERAPQHICQQCGTSFKAERSDARYCSPACRQRARRAR